MNFFTFYPLIEIFTFSSFFLFISKFLIEFIKNYKINKIFIFVLLSLKFFCLLAIFFYGKVGNAVDAKSIYDMSTIFFDKIYNNLSFRNFFGSDVLSIIISPFTNIGQLTYFNISFLFMLLGLYSSLLFYVTLRKYSKNNYQHSLAIIIVLYPTLNIFTSYITKDLLIFFFLSYLLFIINFEKEKKYFLLKLFLLAVGVLLIRPYIFLVLSFSFLIIIVFKYNFKKLNELYLFVFLILIAFLIFLFLFNKIYTQVFLGNGNFLEQFLSYLSDRARITNIGNAKINLYNLNFIQKIFSIIFGPNYFTFSFSNLIFFIDKIYLFFILIHVFLIKLNFNKTKEYYLSLTEQGLLLFALLLCLLLSLSVSNYGIALRLKLMFLPIFFYLIIKKQNSFKLELK